MANPTHAQLTEWFYVDSAGNLRWRVRRANRCRVDDVAGTLHVHKSTGNTLSYRRVCITGYGKLYAHRIAYALHHGIELDQVGVIDHIDGDGLNNSSQNLISTTLVVNAQNTVLRSNNSSGTVGVCWCSANHKWRAYVGEKLNGRSVQTHLGLFADKREAAATALAARQSRGFSATHGRSTVSLLNKH